jgi:hypothetical protein
LSFIGQADGQEREPRTEQAAFSPEKHPENTEVHAQDNTAYFVRGSLR